MNVANWLASGSIEWFVSELAYCERVHVVRFTYLHPVSCCRCSHSAYGKEQVSSALGCFDGVPL